MAITIAQVCAAAGVHPANGIYTERDFDFALDIIAIRRNAPHVEAALAMAAGVSRTAEDDEYEAIFGGGTQVDASAGDDEFASLFPPRDPRDLGA